MKTFREALRVVVPSIKESEATEEKLREISRIADDQEQKFAGLRKEIVTDLELNSILGLVLNAMCPDVQPDPRIARACQHVFLLGVRIGMEMERQDMEL